MGNDETEALLVEIGRVLARDQEYPLDGTFLYAEVVPHVVGLDIFKDLGDHLLYRWPMDGLSDLVLDLWDAASESERWSAMQYLIDGDTFTASFTYPEDFDGKAHSMVRRDRVVAARYGNKRIVYPPL